jgi:ASC-1-like (ASCH) protein
LNFYKEEIKIFERQLEQLLNKNPVDEVCPRVEQFQNKFILQKEIIDHLKHDLNVSEKQLASFASELSGMGLESIKMDNHTKLRERMATFRKLYTEMKTEFRWFEADWF